MSQIINKKDARETLNQTGKFSRRTELLFIVKHSKYIDLKINYYLYKYIIIITN